MTVTQAALPAALTLAAAPAEGGGEVTVTATLTLTIENNDAAISYTLSASPETVVEGGAVTRTGQRGISA